MCSNALSFIARASNVSSIRACTISRFLRQEGFCVDLNITFCHFKHLTFDSLELEMSDSSRNQTLVARSGCTVLLQKKK